MAKVPYLLTGMLIVVLTAIAVAPTSTAARVCVIDDDPETNPPYGDSEYCVFAESQPEWYNCVQFCIYVNLFHEQDVCALLFYHSPYVCLSHVSSLQ